jgi:hypothetical protein
MEESMMLGMMNFMCEMYDECIAEGNSETECELMFDGSDPCDECHETCGDNNDCHDACDEGDCAADDGPPECMQDCPGIETLGPNSDPVESCVFFTSISDNSCTDSCGWEESMMLAMMNIMCETYDDCIAEGNSESECEEFFDMDDDPCGQCHDECDDEGGDDEGECHDDCDENECATEDGSPECLSECEGIHDVDPDGDPSAFCTWASDLLYFADCMDGCDDDVISEITSYTSICTECLIAENCDEAELSTDEKNLLLPEEFTLHPVYPNPFNPTTDIGFSLEYAGPVSISVYDVTGRQIETILHNGFQNAGSYIITWNAYQFPSGIYFIYLQAGKQIDIQKVTLLK